MKTIFKYNLDLIDKQEVEIPANGKILHFGLQDLESLCIWVLIDPANSKEKRHFKIYGTGRSIYDESENYIGTVITSFGLVWHLFEVNN